MSLLSLNPFVRSIAIYEKLNKSGECVAYDARIIYVVSGDLSVSVNGSKAAHHGAGELIYIPAGTRYKLSGQYFMAAVAAFDLTTEFAGEENLPPVSPTEFLSEKCHTVSGLVPFESPIFLSDMESLREDFEKMAKIFIAKESEYLAELSAMLKLILLRVSESAAENALPARMVDALGEYVRENVGDEISNTEVGAIFGYHPFYINNVIKASRGVTLRQYIISYRLKLAKYMLEVTNKSVAEVGEAVGFSDASYFTKTFREAFGETPKAYQKRFKDEFI